MRFIVRQKFFSVRDRYRIQDANGRDAFEVVGRLFSIGKKFSVKDMSGQELYFIKQRLLTLGPKYEIYQQGNKIATFKGRFINIFKKKAKIKTPYGDFKMKGGIWGWNFSITQNDVEAVKISKKILKIADTYAIDTNDQYDPVFMIALAVIIDAAYHGHR